MRLLTHHLTTFIQIARSTFLIFALSLPIFWGSCSPKDDNAYIDSALIDQNEALRLKGQTDSIIELNKKYIGIAKRNNYLRGEMLGYINIANIYATIGKYSDGVLFLDKAASLLNKSTDDYLKMRLYHEYGQLNFVMGLVDVALNYNSKALYHAQKIKPPDSIKRILSNIYTVRADFIKSKNKDSTLFYFHKGRQIEDSELNNALLGNYYSVELKNLDSARFYLDKAIGMLEGQEYWTVRRGVVYSFYAHFLYSREKLDEALIYAEKSAEILSGTNRINKLPFIYSDIIEISELLKNDQKTAEYKEKFRTVNDSLLSTSIKATNIALYGAIREIDKYKSRGSIHKTFYLVSIGVLLVLIVWLVYYKNKTKKAEHNPDASYSINRDDRLNELARLAKENNSEFLVRFNEYYPDFSRKLYNINPSLSSSNITFCAFVWLGFSSKEIAQYTFVQHRSVQTQKSRIRKKLNIDSETDLYKYFREL